MGRSPFSLYPTSLASQTPFLLPVGNRRGSEQLRALEHVLRRGTDLAESYHCRLAYKHSKSLLGTSRPVVLNPHYVSETPRKMEFTAAFLGPPCLHDSPLCVWEVLQGYSRGSGDWHHHSWPSLLPALRLGESWPGIAGMAALSLGTESWSVPKHRG